MSAAASTTRELVLRARGGEAAAFEELVRRHLRAAYAVALAVLGSPQDAEDVAQDAMVVAFERLESCRDPERFAGWLLQIVRNRSLNAVEARRVRGDGAAGLATSASAVEAAHASAAGLEPTAQPEQIALRRELASALSRLTPAQREVVLLHDLHGWTHAEIGAALEISEVMSRQHLFVARRALRALLAGEPAAEGRHGR